MTFIQGAIMARSTKTLLNAFFAAILILSTFVPANAGTIYVDASATGAPDGMSWDDAFTDLQDALACGPPSAAPQGTCGIG